MDLLMEWVATSAFHNSDELYAILIPALPSWTISCSGSVNPSHDFLMWLFGPAGAGKSAIAKTIAEIAAEKGLLIAAFFCSRTSSTRGTKNCLVVTLAYQLALSIPDTDD